MNKLWILLGNFLFGSGLHPDTCAISTERLAIQPVEETARLLYRMQRNLEREALVSILAKRAMVLILVLGLAGNAACWILVNGSGRLMQWRAERQAAEVSRQVAKAKDDAEAKIKAGKDALDAKRRDVQTAIENARNGR